MRARIPPTAAHKKTIDYEIRRQLAEAEQNHNTELDSMILWVLHEKFGFGKKRLKKFYDCFADEIKALTERYCMDDADDAWLCTRKLKEAGIDIYEWSKEDTNNGT